MGSNVRNSRVDGSRWAENFQPGACAFHAVEHFGQLLGHAVDVSFVELRNFGVFEVRLTKSRVGRNPMKPKKDVTIPARATVKFKSGKIMRQRVLLRTQELSKK
jgi:nucleoid DNA-binding protein